MNKLPLSVAIIASNERPNIERCLKSVVDLAAEIVLLINDCTDGTDEVAKQFDARVYYDTWHGFRDQKNLVLDKATQPWVLSIDADEVVTPELAASIRAFVEADNADGAYFARKVWFLGRWILHGDWYPDYSLRLLRRGGGRWCGESIHEKMQVNGRIVKIAGDLEHYSFPTFNTQLNKMASFTDALLPIYLREGRTCSPIFTPLRALWRFFRCYVIKLGFLDGFPGFYVASFQFFSTLFRYARLYEEIDKDAK
ncbi:MAG: hypothetical protein A2Y14_00235 [Verrucomicrobia bacterium GWF2_51_19]|nr:MAG: hypothetical protein A2Y14_00235 [Verrucomicrobia bacterium GWF2_51_19]